MDASPSRESRTSPSEDSRSSQRRTPSPALHLVQVVEQREAADADDEACSCGSPTTVITAGHHLASSFTLPKHKLVEKIGTPACPVCLVEPVVQGLPYNCAHRFCAQCPHRWEEECALQRVARSLCPVCRSQRRGTPALQARRTQVADETAVETPVMDHMEWHMVTDAVALAVGLMGLLFSTVSLLSLGGVAAVILVVGRTLDPLVLRLHRIGYQPPHLDDYEVDLAYR